MKYKIMILWIFKKIMGLLRWGYVASLSSVLKASSATLWVIVKIKCSALHRLGKKKTCWCQRHEIPSRRQFYPISSFSKAETFLSISEEEGRRSRGGSMPEHTWNDEPIIVKLFFLVLLAKKAPEMQVCGRLRRPIKTNHCAWSLNLV